MSFRSLLGHLDRLDHLIHLQSQPKKTERLQQRVSPMFRCSRTGHSYPSDEIKIRG